MQKPWARKMYQIREAKVEVVLVRVRTNEINLKHILELEFYMYQKPDPTKKIHSKQKSPNG